MSIYSVHTVTIKYTVSPYCSIHIFPIKYIQYHYTVSLCSITIKYSYTLSLQNIHNALYNAIMQCHCSIHIFTIQCSYVQHSVTIQWQCPQCEFKCHYKGYVHSVTIHAYNISLYMQCTDIVSL